MPLLPMEELMTIHEIIVSVLRKHLITRKIAEQIADEIAEEIAKGKAEKK
jgi:DNA integrity scanning protein DisA with diadenylate cyclase activity